MVGAYVAVYVLRICRVGFVHCFGKRHPLQVGVSVAFQRASNFHVVLHKFESLQEF